jgi:hypothetical protein
MIISIAKTINGIAVSDEATQLTIAGVGIKGKDGISLPNGGAVNMVLTKKSTTDGDAQWVDTLDDLNMNGGYF